VITVSQRHSGMIRHLTMHDKNKTLWKIPSQARNDGESLYKILLVGLGLGFKYSFSPSFAACSPDKH